MSGMEMLALVHGAVGIEMFGFGFLRSHGAGHSECEAMFIIAFLLFVSANILMALIMFGELKGNQIATIVTMILFFLAALFILVGWALWADHVNTIGDSYGYTLDVVSTCMAILAGVFLLLGVLGVGGKTGPA